MEDLINAMTLDDPAKRPRIEEVLENFALVRASRLSNGKLRFPILSKDVPKLFRVLQQARQSLRTLQYVMSHYPAIPNDLGSLQVSRAAMS